MAIKKQEPIESWLPEFLVLKAEMESEQQFWCDIKRIGFANKLFLPDVEGFHNMIIHSIIPNLSSHFSVIHGRVIKPYFIFRKETFIDHRPEGFSFEEFISKLKGYIKGVKNELEEMLYA